LPLKNKEAKNIETLIRNVIFRHLNAPNRLEEILRKYSNREYNKLSSLENDALTEAGYNVVNNWRLLHTTPLDIITKKLTEISQAIDASVIVSKRIKRLASITPKIKKGYTLTQIQDIGGCRAIFDNYKHIKDCINDLIICDIFSSVRLTDYIENPKESGYRGVHLVCTYKSDDNRYNGLKIEIQLRTRVQHTWATALEIVDIYTGQNLKGGIGSAKWLRFFALVASCHAQGEYCPIIPNTSNDTPTLIRELLKLDNELGARTILLGIGQTVELPNENVGYDYFILECTDTIVYFTPIEKEHYETGLEIFIELEKQAKKGEVIAFVSAKSIASLREAYPNLFNDSYKFLALLELMFDGY
jgi:ppGpp synthetase/RelA/SpoT-type nucleotidyltranferase